MNPLAQIILTVALVAAGVGGYHFIVVDDGAADEGVDVDLAERDLGALETRLDAVEGRSPVLVGAPATGLADRISKLEKRLAALETAGITVTDPEAGADGTPVTATAPSEPVELEDGSVSPLSAAEEKRIRDLVSAAMQERRRGMTGSFMDRTLERLGIELTDDQKKQLGTALDDHRTKMRDLFMSSRESGLTREEMGAQMQELNRQLTEKVSTFIPAADAEAITAGLSAMGGGRGPGGRGPGGGR